MANSLTQRDSFTHPGVVSRIAGNSVFVRLDSNVHCESCRAKSACGMSGAAIKEVEVNEPPTTFTLEEPVQVILKKGTGFMAVFWAYILPFLLMMSSLLLALAYVPEWMAGLLALGILVPYYFILHQLTDSFKEKFKVSVIKTGTQ
jgi:sigma-E factor negative regulatory protein RseC